MLRSSVLEQAFGENPTGDSKRYDPHTLYGPYSPNYLEILNQAFKGSSPGISPYGDPEYSPQVSDWIGWAANEEEAAAGKPNLGQYVGFLSNLPGVSAPTGYYSIPSWAEELMSLGITALGVPGIMASLGIRGVAAPFISAITGWGQPDPFVEMLAEAQRAAEEARTQRELSDFTRESELGEESYSGNWSGMEEY